MSAKLTKTMQQSLLLRIILANQNDGNCGEFSSCDTSSGVSDGASRWSARGVMRGGAPQDLHHLPLTASAASLTTPQLLRELQVLDDFRRHCDNLYHRVRALFFLYAVHRFHLPLRRKTLEKQHEQQGSPRDGSKKGDWAKGEHKVVYAQEQSQSSSTETIICPEGYAALLDRRFEEAIDCFLASVPASPCTIPINHGSNKNGQNGWTTKNDQELCQNNDHLVPRRTSLISNLTFESAHTHVEPVENVKENFTRLQEFCSHNSKVPPLKQLSTGSSTSSGMTLADPTMDEGTNRTPPLSRLLLPSAATSSALAKAYRALAFQTLADQVKESVRSHPGNDWMFEVEEVRQQRLTWSEELWPATYKEGGLTLRERTPVRMDLSHSCWSDIFFLGMDYPEAARVINCSIDLAVMQHASGKDTCEPAPPIECRLQLTRTNPGTITLTSIDLKASTVLTHVSEVFNFGTDYLGLLKAGLVASGVVPLGLEKRCATAEGDVELKELLRAMMPSVKEGYGLELTTHVHGIPKGSRLAVSTNLLGSIIAVSMRATCQTATIAGALLESERRLVAARAILGEYLGGSGGGWQDSGGVWPGLKLIHGVVAKEGDPEYGVSRGRLLPNHVLLQGESAPTELLAKLEQSLVLVHGGMAQNVG